MISRVDSLQFETMIMDSMEAYKDKIKNHDDLERFSDELHCHIEIAIQDMLEDGFNGIDPDDYEAQY